MTIDDLIPDDLNFADELMKSGRPADAVPIYRKWAEAHPDEDSHLFALAWALYDSGDAVQAIACFEQLLQKEISHQPFTGFAYDELVRIYRERKNWEGLVSVCERTMAAQPEDIGVIKTLGEAYLSAGMAAEAVRVFEKLVRQEPDAPAHRCSLGDAFLAEGDAIHAEAEYKRASEIDPLNEALFFSRLANGLFRSGHPERAKAAWEKCLAVRPDESLFWMGLGDCLVRLGEPVAAAEAYNRGVRLHPEAAGTCWHRLGSLLSKEGFHPHAAEAYLKAIALEPVNPLYLLRLAASYAAQGRNNLAKAALRQAHSLKSRTDGR